jgi:hypothetical protein
MSSAQGSTSWPGSSANVSMTMRSQLPRASSSSFEINVASLSSLSLAALGTPIEVRTEPPGEVPRVSPARLSTMSLTVRIPRINCRAGPRRSSGIRGSRNRASSKFSRSATACSPEPAETRYGPPMKLMLCIRTSEYGSSCIRTPGPPMSSFFKIDRTALGLTGEAPLSVSAIPKAASRCSRRSREAFSGRSISPEAAATREGPSMFCRMLSVRMPATDESFHAVPTATSERSRARQQTGQERGHLFGTPRTVVIGASVLGTLRPCLRPDGGPYPCGADHPDRSALLGRSSARRDPRRSSARRAFSPTLSITQRCLLST